MTTFRDRDGFGRPGDGFEAFISGGETIAQFNIGETDRPLYHKARQANTGADSQPGQEGEDIERDYAGIRPDGRGAASAALGDCGIRNVE